MAIDYNQLLSENQAITASAASTNVVDLGDVGNSPANRTSGAIDVLGSITEAFNNLTSLKVGIRTADNASMTSPTVLAEQTITLASGGLGLGKQIALRTLPKQALRYVDGYYTVTGTAPSTGKVFLGLGIGQQTNA